MRLQNKFPLLVRPIVITLAIIFFGIAAITWIGKAWGDWSGVMTAIFSIAGAVSSFFTIPFLYNDKQSEPTTPTVRGNSTQPLIHISFSENRNSDLPSPLLVTDSEKGKDRPSLSQEKPLTDLLHLLPNSSVSNVASASSTPPTESFLKLTLQEHTPKFGSDEHFADFIFQMTDSNKEGDEFRFTDHTSKKTENK